MLPLTEAARWHEQLFPKYAPAIRRTIAFTTTYSTSLWVFSDHSDISKCSFIPKKTCPKFISILSAPSATIAPAGTWIPTWDCPQADWVVLWTRMSHLRAFRTNPNLPTCVCALKVATWKPQKLKGFLVLKDSNRVPAAQALAARHTKSREIPTPATFGRQTMMSIYTFAVCESILLQWACTALKLAANRFKLDVNYPCYACASLLLAQIKAGFPTGS